MNEEKKLNLFILYFGCKTNNDDNTPFKFKGIIIWKSTQSDKMMSKHSVLYTIHM